MHDAPISSDAADAADAARKIVDTYLTVLMKPDPEGARRYVAADLRIRFTGGRAMDDPAQCTAFNASRYRWVKKRFESTDVVVGATPQSAVVYNRGTLYGEWLDGTPFEGNRYVDRYVLRGGLIVEMDVWNDSAEWMLSRAQGAQP
ncbi:nuclear transport factor 2-like protein [Orrella dioscoreae]|uniref:Inner membrane protein n=1 Tax=Orrella dioscoreae TaxID=1851544 RepID=A0A1C3K5V0_9BURK|nr:nuclear transport factor 2 family protein [Orrella dioscoreae]SBT26834.1 Putative inner membrane protein [Orrella dioscoreae]SOE52433.1 Putative inner membrane protein [Orrella dioscoreae]